MKRIVVVSLLALSSLIVFVAARAANQSRKINLPTSKTLTLPVPGYLARTNSFPATIALSPDGRYAALLNQGYGTLETSGRQSIAILDLSNNQLRDFPDDRLGGDAHQSYFIGLAFSSDGKHLYASMGSITDPTGERPGNLGNGIAVYNFADGKVTPERFIKIPPQRLAEGKEVAYGVRKTPPGTAIPYPAGFAVLPSAKGDRLLIANNLSDNVVLLDVSFRPDSEVLRPEPQSLRACRISIHSHRQQGGNQSMGQLVEWRCRSRTGPSSRQGLKVDSIRSVGRASGLKFSPDSNATQFRRGHALCDARE